MKKMLILMFIFMFPLFGQIGVTGVNTQEATAWNEARRLGHFRSTDYLGFLYTDENQVKWAISTDNGSSWETGYVGDGVFPTLTGRWGLLDVNVDGTTWYSGQGAWDYGGVESALLKGGRYTSFGTPIPSEWIVTNIDALQGSETKFVGFGHPAVAKDGAGYNHLAYEEFETDNMNYAQAKLCYRKFDESWNPVSPVETLATVSTSLIHPVSPSIAIDNNNIPHIVDCYNGEVYYFSREGGVWSDAINLSTKNQYAKEAFIDYYNDKLWVVMTEEVPADNGNGDIYLITRDMTISPPNPSLWSYPEDTIPYTSSDDSRYPQIQVGRWVVFNENVGDTNWEVYLCDLATGQTYNISYTTEASLYPQENFYQDELGARVEMIWTEGDNAPYEIIYKTQSAPLAASLTPAVGQEEPSPYTVERDGYITYPSGISVDYDTDALIYSIPLPKDFDFTLQVVGYHESKGKWNEQVKLDGRKARVLKVKAGIPETLNLDIPYKYYEDDGRIEIRIRRLTGEYASISRLALYAYPRPLEKEETKGKSKVTQVPGSLKNSEGYTIRYNRGNILYSVPKASYVSIGVYDITGRCIKEINQGWRASGIYNVPVNMKSGIYFIRLKADKNVITKKVVIIK